MTVSESQFLPVSRGHWKGRGAYRKETRLRLGLQPSHNLISSSGCTSWEANMKTGAWVSVSQTDRPHSVAGQTRWLAGNEMLFGWHRHNVSDSSQMLFKARGERVLPEALPAPDPELRHRAGPPAASALTKPVLCEYPLGTSRWEKRVACVSSLSPDGSPLGLILLSPFFR